VILRPIEVFLSSIVGFQDYFGMKIGEMIWTTCPGVQTEINLKNFPGIDDIKMRSLTRLRGFNSLNTRFYFFSSMIFRDGRADRGVNRL
jgi:hypothetical protein